jgi:hypothetical protein
MSLAQYRDIFGKPGEGAHAWRVCGLAAVDVLLTVLLALFVSMASGKSLMSCFVAMMLLAVVCHLAFHVNTRLNMTLFGAWKD